MPNLLNRNPNTIMNTNFSVQYINASEINAVNVLSNSLKKGECVQVVLFKELDMNKGTKNNRNPFLGRAFERQTMGGWQVGTNYDKSCQNAAERSGSDTDFTGKPSWHTYYNDFFETDKASRSKFYLQLQRSEKQGNSFSSTIYLDGREITPSEFEELKPWLKSKGSKQSSSQVEAGITEENERKYKVVALRNIESIKQGEFHYNIVKVEAETEAEVMARG